MVRDAEGCRDAEVVGRRELGERVELVVGEDLVADLEGAQEKPRGEGEDQRRGGPGWGGLFAKGEQVIDGKKVVVVLPAYNAGRTLEPTFLAIPRDCVDDVVLVDDGSSDDTVEVARTLGIRHLQIGRASCRERGEI